MDKDKPILGITPRHIHEELRLFEIKNAILRRFQDDIKIPKERVEEYNYLSFRKERSKDD